MSQLYFSWLVLFFVVCLVLCLWGGWSLSKDYKLHREKSSSFECGFDGKDVSRLPFSLRFFLMMILFVVFDMEMCLLLGLPFMVEGNLWDTHFYLLLVLLVLLVGGVEEWRRGLLWWKS